MMLPCVRCTVARTKRSPSSPVALSSRVEVSRTIFSLSRTRFVYKDKGGRKDESNGEHRERSDPDTHTAFLTSHDSPLVAVIDSSFV